MTAHTVTSGSAVSVLNATAAPYGAAIGIDVPLVVEISKAEGVILIPEPVESGTILLESCITVFQTKTGLEVDDIKLLTRSPLPPAKGLKTSSAISCATIMALSLHYKHPLSLANIVMMSAEASLACGVSITGAIDDAYACFCGGLSFTKNRNQELISLKQAPSGLEAVLLIPEKSKPKTEIKNLLKEVCNLQTKSALQHFLVGDVIGAIRENTKAYAPVLLDDCSLITELSHFNCEVIGLNGAGPSLFALCRPQNVMKFVENVKEQYFEYSVFKSTFKQLKVKLEELS